MSRIVSRLGLSLLLLLATGGYTALPGLAQPSAARSNITDERAPFYLSQFRDKQLQAGLEQLLAAQSLTRHAASGKLAVGILDITDPDKPRYAAVNPHHMMYAASLPKIAILLGAYHRAATGGLTLDARTRKQMTDMIRYSDNAAATDILNRVGRRYLIDLLRSDALRLYDPELNGGLWVGKDYGPVGAYRRDPLHNISHGATVYQVLRYFFLLENGGLVLPKYHDSMKEMLSKPGIEHKFVKGLASHPEAEIYRKSGSWRNFHADAALVEADGHSYVMVAIAENAEGGQWLANLAAPLYELLGRNSPTPPPALARQAVD